MHGFKLEWAMYFSAEGLFALWEIQGTPPMDVIDQGGGRMFLLSQAPHNYSTQNYQQYGLTVSIWNQMDKPQSIIDHHKLPHKIAALTNREVLVLTRDMEKDNFQTVGLDTDKDHSAIFVPIAKFIQELERFINRFNPWLANLDLHIQFLDRLRKSGEAYDSKFDFVPVNCEACRGYFGLHDVKYRDWRNRKTPQILCPKCHTMIERGLSEKVMCCQCFQDFAYMPLTIYEDMKNTKQRWYCHKCETYNAGKK